MQLEAIEISKKYGNKSALEQCSVRLTDGIYGLLGENGAGKSTLMQILCGLQEGDTGKVLCEGISIKEMGEQYFEILGYLPQKFGYYENFSVRDYLKYSARLKGIIESKIDDRIEEVLEVVNLLGKMEEKMKKLSGGMKQRVGIAQSLLNNPKILIMDEPTVGLDPMERANFRNFLSEYTQGRIVMYSTHIVSDIEHMADELLLLKEGKIICSGKHDIISDTLRGRVWECHVDAREAEIMKERYCVCNIRKKGENMILRIVSQSRPCMNAKVVEHTLEDVYFYKSYEERKR